MAFKTLLRATVFVAAALSPLAQAGDSLLNVSYDVARGFYKEFNPAFIADYKAKTGEAIKVEQSHGGSSKQARSVIDGLQADVVTMNNPLDIDAIADKAGLLPKDWASKFPNNAAPSYSAILFVVKRGNPKGIKDWDDLVKPGVKLVIPNPKTSGNGRYSYLAAWEYARRKGGEAAAKEFVTQLFAHVPVLDTGGRGATTTFAQRGIGDVLLTFENEVRLIKDELGPDKFDVVIPSLTVRADNPVAVIEKVANKHGNAALAKAYLDYHFSPAGQALIAKNDLRPIDETVLKAHTATLPPLNLFTVEQAFGSWPAAQKTHFADGGVFDQIVAAGR
jgi:sulfate transport system substrate-binding protein